MRIELAVRILMRSTYEQANNLQGDIAQRGAVGVVGAFALSTSAKQIEQSKVFRGLAYSRACVFMAYELVCGVVRLSDIH
jgi:hypothetical protein